MKTKEERGVETLSIGKIEAPWTAAQVDALNLFQQDKFIHPFTCPDHHEGERALVATRAGWICCHCSYTQTWAHAYMASKTAAERAKYMEEIFGWTPYYQGERRKVIQISPKEPGDDWMVWNWATINWDKLPYGVDEKGIVIASHTT